MATSGQQTSGSITLNVTTERWRIFGLLALIMGAVLSFYMSVWLPHQRDRELAILPFARVAERLELVRAAIDPTSAPLTLDQAKRLMAELQPAWLQSHMFIPPRWPSPTATTINSDDLKAQMLKVEARLAAIQLLARSIAISSDPNTKTNLDNLATDPNFPQPTLESDIQRILGSSLVTTLKPAGRITPAEIIYREEVRNVAYWLISSILAVLLGYVLMIDRNAAFGGWDDVASALLWALGIATTGTKLADLTVGGIRTALRAS